MTNRRPADPVAMPRRDRRRDLLFLGAFALAKVLIHIPFLARYGVHRDELYFIACGERPAFGYADHAPIVPWLAAASRWLLGDSWLSLRVFALLAGAGTVFLTGLLARRLGGDRFAQALACLSVMVAPVFLRTANQFAIPSFEPLMWTGASFVLAGILAQRTSPRRWPAFGLITGLGLLVKHTMLLYGVGVVVGLALTRQRRHFRSPWLWAGGGLALLLFLPNLVWQAQHDWATLAFIRNLNAEVMSTIPRAGFLLGQVLYLHPLTLPVWLAGAIWLFRGSSGALRPLAWVYVVLMAVLLVIRSKIYYSAPIYPTLLAAGGVAWARLTSAAARRWARPVVLGVVVVTGAALFPLSVPVLPIEDVDAFADSVTFGLAGDAREITGDLHDMWGWREQAEVVWAQAAALPEGERDRLVLLAGNYGEAGALEYYAPEGLAVPVVSPHLSYFLWGPAEADGDVVLAIGIDEDDLRALFADVTRAGVADGSPHAVSYERDRPIYLCREPFRPLGDAWPERMRL